LTKLTKTVSEAAFETFLRENGLSYEPIEEATTPRPDYLVHAGDLNLVFEVKELAEDENFRDVADPSSPIIRVHSRIVGDHVRRKISEARKQVQHAAKQGLPSILLIYNNLDPLFLFGTEDHDFVTAMYGEYTLAIDKATKKIAGEPFYGRNQSLSEIKNTSFSAVGRLHPRTGITLFENAFAKIKLPYDQIPPCFEVRRVEITH
jgi:hypothetical protein